MDGPDKEWSPKTCNLRLTAVRSLLSYASEECMDITPVFVSSKTIHSLTVPSGEIEYFEDHQMLALLRAPDGDKRSERRNRMLLILGYDAAMRVGELVSLKMGNLHVDAETPYVRILEKGEKYRSVPLMKKTVLHLKDYLREFHKDSLDSESPLFYTTTHGRIHGLSDDCIQKVLKKYVEKCQREGIRMLGHKNISTTSGFYAFATLNTLAKAIEKTNPEKADVEKYWKREEISKALYRL